MTFKEENDNLLKFMLNERFFKQWRHRGNIDPKSLVLNTKLELFITTNCNQKCEYCYLIKYKDELYPSFCNDKETILNNLQILLDYFDKENFFFLDIDLFSGEIWEYQFGLDILEVLYQQNLKKKFVNVITIPSNCSFLRNQKQTNLIQRYINKFNKIGVRIQFSISVDGKIIENNSRPYANGEVKNDNFYENMFLFAYHNEYLFHPMISANNIKDWIENYRWWQNNLKEYGFSDNALMMLEVRNNNWTNENINDFINFLNFVIDDTIKNYGKEHLFKTMLCDPNYQVTLPDYSPIFLTESDTFAGCTVSDTLTIRLGDLAICPCHRTCYDKYLYGKFIVKDKEIVDIESNNTQMAIRILFANNNLCHLGCDSCVFNKYCMKGCFGAQLEATNDPFIPAKSVCNLFKKKTLFLIWKYDQLGFFDYCKNISPYSPIYNQAESLLTFKQEVLKNVGQY